MSSIKSWFDGLNKRERNMVLTLGIMMILLIIFIAVVIPVKSYLQRLDEQVTDAERDLPELAAKVAALQSRSGAAQTETGLSLNQLIMTSSKRYGLKFSRIEERKRDEEIQVRLDAVEFDQLLRWIVQLEQQRGLVVDSLRVSDTDVSGMVDASIKLIKPS